MLCDKTKEHTADILISHGTVITLVFFIKLRAVSAIAELLVKFTVKTRRREAEMSTAIVNCHKGVGAIAYADIHGSVLYNCEIWSRQLTVYLKQ